MEIEFCCKKMKKYSSFQCEIHDDKYQCPETLIDYHESLEKFGLIIHDGGNSMIEISYCPWCGTKL